MRLYYVLIITAISMAFATGYFVLFLQGNITARDVDVVRINQLKMEFQKRVDPRIIINLNSQYHGRHMFKLLSPVFTVANPSAESNRIDYASDKHCFETLPKLLDLFDYDKIWMWEEYRCGQRRYLPRTFFESPPFMHPSGFSYALLAYRKGDPPFKSPYWLRNNLTLFHVMELNKLKEIYEDLDGVQLVLSRLSDDELSSLVKGEGTILTKDFLLARLKYDTTYTILEYRVYYRSELNEFLKHTGYRVMNFRPGRSCFYRDGKLCWGYETRKLFQLVNSSSIIFFGGSLLIISIVVWMLLSKIRLQKAEEERKRLALQVLTHEFRTPVASLLLQVEQIQKHFDSLKDDLQEPVLRLSSDVYRLQRLTEKSRQYLKAQTTEKLVDLQEAKINNLNHFVEEILMDYEEVRFEGLSEELAVNLDGYWLGVCLKNLLENAHAHGKAPVSVSLEKKDKEVRITVSDSGQCQFSTLEEMTPEFKKGGQSKGSGLGMNIVNKVIKEMGGQLLFKRNPTTFTIVLSLKKKEKKNG